MSNIEKEQLIQKINTAIDTVRPHLVADGGNVEVVEVTEDMRVQVRWLGTCENCQMSIMTMKAGLEQAIKNQIPEITGVEAVNGVTFSS